MNIKSIHNETWIAILFSILCIVLPWSLAAMQIAAILTGLTYIIYTVYFRKKVIKIDYFYIFVLIYLISQIFSSALSPKPAASLISVFNNDWYIILVPILASISISQKWRIRAFHLLIASATAVGLYGILQSFTGFTIFRSSPLAKMGTLFRAAGGYNFYLTYAGNQLLALGITFSCFLLEKKWSKRRVMYAIALVIIFISIIASFGRSTWIASLFILLLGSWLVKKRLFGFLSSAILLSIILLALLSPEISDRIVSIFEPSRNEARLNIWRTSWAMFSDHKLFGIGPGMFNNTFWKYQVPGFYDAFGHAHNDFLNIAVNSGLFGLITWMLMWMMWFYYTYRALKSIKMTRIDRKIIFGAQLAIGGILVAAFFQCYYTDLENNIFWWTLAASALLVIHDTKKKEPDKSG